MTDEAKQIRDLIEQVLFTHPGERLNQPDFGVGLKQYVFEPNSSELRTRLQNEIQRSLNHWLSNKMEVEEVEITLEESSIAAMITYKVISTNELRRDVFYQDIH